MPDAVIKVENLSKQYRIGARQQGYRTFREAIVDTAKSPFRLINTLISSRKSFLSSTDDTIWALNNVSLEIRQGEVIGIIGRNGAGKSTLLKIISKITEPTKGKVKLQGRTGSLLEIGTGFHPELTGHENIYLYGAILGMDRWEVTKKFDEIVAFSELEKFINTPVKRYSSGMYMRLAFAVAAHLETEILLVDEVLSVGDISFRKKCLGKMGKISSEGRTVIFVSHNLGAISALCNKTIVLDKGILKFFGNTGNALLEYSRSALANRSEWIVEEPETKEGVSFKALRIKDTAGTLRSDFSNKEEIIVEIELEILSASSDLKIGFQIEEESGNLLFQSFHNDIEELLEHKSLKAGIYHFRARLPNRLFSSKMYFISPQVGLHKKRWLFQYEKVTSFTVNLQLDNKDIFIDSRPGMICPFIKWKLFKG